jgi:hypothetical protein
VLRKNETEAAREHHRLEDKLAKLEERIAARNQGTKNKQRCQPEAGKRKLEAWIAQHKLNGLVELKLEGRMLIVERQEAAIATSLQLAGCYVVTTDVLPESMSTQEVPSLASLCLMHYKVDEKTTVTKLPQPSANQTKILTALGVTLPRCSQTLSQHKSQQP